jgi:hypothetical protein
MPSARQRKRQRLAKRQRQEKARAVNLAKTRDTDTPEISEQTAEGAFATALEGSRDQRTFGEHDTPRISERETYAANRPSEAKSHSLNAADARPDTPGTSDQNTQAALAAPASKPTLYLKRPIEQGTVRQSFSHGRSKAVVVEKVKRRPSPDELRAREQDEARQREEDGARQRAEEEAKRAEEEIRRRAEEEARQLAEEEARRAEEGVRRREEEEARQRAVQEARRRAEEEARRERTQQVDPEGRRDNAENARRVILQPVAIVPRQTQQAIAFTSVNLDHWHWCRIRPTD